MRARLFEGYGPGGVAVLVEALTDNDNRTVSAVRHAFTKYGGNLGESGSVVFQFAHKAVVVAKHAGSADEAELAAIDAGAEDIEKEEDDFFISAAAEQLAALREGLTKAGFTVERAEQLYVPTQTVPNTQPESIAMHL